MAPLQIAHVKNCVSKIHSSSEPGSRFAQVLAQKKSTDTSNLPKTLVLEPTGSMNKIFTNMISNHETSTKALSSHIVRKDYTPEKLLKSQFNISMFLLREQMYAKTVELTA